MHNIVYVYNLDLVSCLCHLEDAGGEGHLPYLKAKEGYLKATGLPDGQELRKPNLYGQAALRKILEAEANILFEICK